MRKTGAEVRKSKMILVVCNERENDRDNPTGSLGWTDMSRYWGIVSFGAIETMEWLSFLNIQSLMVFFNIQTGCYGHQLMFRNVVLVLNAWIETLRFNFFKYMWNQPFLILECSKILYIRTSQFVEATLYNQATKRYLFSHATSWGTCWVDWWNSMPRLTAGIKCNKVV